MGRRTIPWDQVKQEYTCGSVNEQGQRVWPSLRELARKYSISISTLWQRKQRENWDALRERNRAEIDTKSIQFFITRVADTQARINEMALYGALRLMEEALAGVQRYREQVARIFADETLDTSERTRQLKDVSQALKNYAQAFSEAYEKARLAVGEPSEVSEGRITLERFVRETLMYIEMEQNAHSMEEGISADQSSVRLSLPCSLCARRGR